MHYGKEFGSQILAHFVEMKKSLANTFLSLQAQNLFIPQKFIFSKWNGDGERNYSTKIQTLISQKYPNAFLNYLIYRAYNHLKLKIINETH